MNFVMSYVIFPHEPFYFDANGNVAKALLLTGKTRNATWAVHLCHKTDKKLLIQCSRGSGVLLFYNQITVLVHQLMKQFALIHRICEEF